MSTTTQDAQVAKQAAQQITHNTKNAKTPDDGAKNGPTTHVDPTQPRAKQKSLAEAANTARSTKVNNGSPVVQATPDPKVTKVPTHAAINAADKAPHTKRAISQDKEATKLATAQEAVDKALTAMTEASTLAATSKKNDPERLAKFTAKTQAELAYVQAKKHLASLKRELAPTKDASPPAKKAAAATSPKTPRAPAANRAIKPGPTEYGDKPTWTGYMIKLARAHKSTDAATAAHKAGAAKAGHPADKALDFKWMDAKGYIILGS